MRTGCNIVARAYELTHYDCHAIRHPSTRVDICVHNINGINVIIKINESCVHHYRVPPYIPVFKNIYARTENKREKETHYLIDRLHDLFTLHKEFRRMLLFTNYDETER